MDLSEETIELNLPASYSHLGVIGVCIKEMLQKVKGDKDPEELCYDIQLAVQEACTNIVKHAYAGDKSGRIIARMVVCPDSRALEIELMDAGISFEPGKVPQPDLSDVQDHGYGLFLLYHLMDEVNYLPEPGNNHWYLVKKL